MSVTDQRKEGVQKVKNCRRHLSTAPKKDGTADVGGNFTLRRQNGTWREEEEAKEQSQKVIRMGPPYFPSPLFAIRMPFAHGA